MFSRLLRSCAFAARIRLTAAAAVLLAMAPAVVHCQIPPSVNLSLEDAQRLQAEIARLQGLVKTAGDQTTITYAVARTYAAAGQYSDAMRVLALAVTLKVGLDPSEDESFAKLRGSKEFERLLAFVRADTPPVIRSRVAFTIDDEKLFPEGIAYSPTLKRLFVGSIFRHSILACTLSGDCSTVVKENADGVGAVLGLRISPVDGSLWAAANSASESGVFHFSLPSGKLIRKYTIDRGGKAHLFNDLVVSPNGDVFITDTNGGTVLWISHKTDRLEVFDPDLKIFGANGVAITDNGVKLFVAGFGYGITVVDLRSKSARPIAHPAGLCLATIDGLYYSRGNLIAIQNDIMVPRVVRFHLSRDRSAIEHFEILERRNPHYDIPTTGAIVGNAFYYMANTQLDSLTDDKIKPGATLNPIKILRLDLTKP